MHIIIYSVRPVTSCFLPTQTVPVQPRGGTFLSLHFWYFQSSFSMCKLKMCPNRRMRNETVLFLRGGRRRYTCGKPPVISSRAEVNGRRKYSSKCTHIWGRLKLKANSCRPACRTVSPSSGQSSSGNTKKTFSFTHLRSVSHKKRHLLHKGRITSPQRVYLRLLEACKKRIQSRVSAEKTPTSELQRAVFTSETSLFMQISASDHWRLSAFLRLFHRKLNILGGFGQDKQCEDAILNSAGEDIFNPSSVIAQIHGRVSYVK